MSSESVPDFRKWATMRIRVLLKDYRSMLNVMISKRDRATYQQWIAAMEKELARRG